jgi:hypothetical protein
MSDDKAKKDPSTRSLAYNQMLPAWKKIETLLSGTAAMRAAGELYLPKHENEKSDAYEKRRKSSVLFNLSALTLDSWVGRPFSDPVTPNDDVPKQVEPVLDDVDLQGNNLTVFGRNWFKEGLAKCFAHVMVEMPVVDKENRTVADDLRENVRPYWTLIKPENLIFATGTMVESQEVLTHVRILEEETERDGFAEMVTQRIRVFDLAMVREDPENPESGEVPRVFWSLWRKVKKDEWEEEVRPTMLEIDRIPIVTFYADREDLMQGKPPLEDLVDLNISHWQSSSDQKNILRVTRFPLLAASGVQDEEAVVEVGPNRMLSTTNPEGKFYYVEHSGASIAAGQNDLDKLEEQMANYGAEFLKKRPGGMTATARALDSAEATSPLQDATIRFQDAVNQALDLTARYLKIESAGSVTVNKEFGPEEVVQGDMQTLDKARDRRDLSQEDYWEELKRRGTLRDEFDADENKRRLEVENADFGNAGAGEDIDEQADDFPLKDDDTTTEE